MNDDAAAPPSPPSDAPQQLHELHDGASGSVSGPGGEADAAKPTPSLEQLRRLAKWRSTIGAFAETVLDNARAPVATTLDHPLHNWSVALQSTFRPDATTEALSQVRFERQCCVVGDLPSQALTVSERFVVVDKLTPRGRLTNAVHDDNFYIVSVGVDMCRVSPMDPAWVTKVRKQRWVADDGLRTAVWSPTTPAAATAVAEAAKKKSGPRGDAAAECTLGPRNAVSALRVAGKHLTSVLVYLLQQVAVASRCSGTRGTATTPLIEDGVQPCGGLGSDVCESALRPGVQPVVYQAGGMTVAGAVESIVHVYNRQRYIDIQAFTPASGSSGSSMPLSASESESDTDSESGAVDATQRAHSVTQYARLDANGGFRSLHCSCLLSAARSHKRASRQLDGFEELFMCAACARFQDDEVKRSRQRKAYSVKMRKVRLGRGIKISMPVRWSARAATEVGKQSKQVRAGEATRLRLIAMLSKDRTGKYAPSAMCGCCFSGVLQQLLDQLAAAQKANANLAAEVKRLAKEAEELQQKQLCVDDVFRPMAARIADLRQRYAEAVVSQHTCVRACAHQLRATVVLCLTCARTGED